MKKILTATLLVLCIAGYASAQKTYYCQTKIINTVDGKTQTAYGKAWMKSPTVFRMEKSVNGKEMIIIGNGANLWLVDPATKRGIHSIQPSTALQQLQAQKRIVGNDLDGFMKAGAHKVGRKTLDGKVCDIYQRKDARNGAVYTLWVQEGADKLTRREEVKATLRLTPPGGKKPQVHHIVSITDIYDWKINSAMPNSLFTVPAGYNIQNAASAPGQAPAK